MGMVLSGKICRIRTEKDAQFSAVFQLGRHKPLFGLSQLQIKRDWIKVQGKMSQTLRATAIPAPWLQADGITSVSLLQPLDEKEAKALPHHYAGARVASAARWCSIKVKSTNQSINQYCSLKNLLGGLQTHPTIPRINFRRAFKNAIKINCLLLCGTK